MDRIRDGVHRQIFRCQRHLSQIFWVVRRFFARLYEFIQRLFHRTPTMHTSPAIRESGSESAESVQSEEFDEREDTALESNIDNLERDLQLSQKNLSVPEFREEIKSVAHGSIRSSDDTSGGETSSKINASGSETEEKNEYGSEKVEDKIFIKSPDNLSGDAQFSQIRASESENEIKPASEEVVQLSQISELHLEFRKEIEPVEQRSIRSTDDSSDDETSSQINAPESKTEEKNESGSEEVENKAFKRDADNSLEIKQLSEINSPESENEIKLESEEVIELSLINNLDLEFGKKHEPVEQEGIRIKDASSGNKTSRQINTSESETEEENESGSEKVEDKTFIRRADNLSENSQLHEINATENENEQKVESEEVLDTTYIRRASNTNASQYLCQIKLVSLALFRLLHDTNIKEFYLGTDMEELDAFYDIGIRIQTEGSERSLLLLILINHKTDHKEIIVPEVKSDLRRWCDNISKVKEMIHARNNQNMMFNRGLHEAEYLLLVHTNADYKICDSIYNIDLEGELANLINDWIGTSHSKHLLYKEKDLEAISIDITNEVVLNLAERLATFIISKDNKSMDILKDEYIMRYHVLLGQQVVTVSDIMFDEHNIDLKWRVLTIRPDLFQTSDKYILLLLKNIYTHIIRTYINKTKNVVKSKLSSGLEKEPTHVTATTVDDDMISSFLTKPSAATLNPLIETHICCLIEEAKLIFAKNILVSLKLKVPIEFGNVDLVLEGNAEEIEERIDILANVIRYFCFKYIPQHFYRIIELSQTFDHVIPWVRGGLSGLVGNILVWDEETQLLKFTGNEILLSCNANALYQKIKSRLENFECYRFDIDSAKLPKLSFDHIDIVRDVLHKLIIYPKQNNHHDTEKLLKNEIQKHHDIYPLTFATDVDLIYLYYFNEIRKWHSTKLSNYLTKEKDIYQQVINNIANEPQIGMLLKSFYVLKLKNIEYTFTESITKCIREYANYSRMCVVTEAPTWTAIKVVQALGNNDKYKYAVLYFEYIAGLSIIDFTTLKVELQNTDRVLIIVCDGLNETDITSAILEIIDELGRATAEKELILVTNDTFRLIVMGLFSGIKFVFSDKKQNLNDFIIESQKELTHNVNVIFQGLRQNFEETFDYNLTSLIKGDVFQEIVNKKCLIVSETINNMSETKYYAFKNKHLDDSKSLFDPLDNALIINESNELTLITDLWFKVKEYKRNMWIVTINYTANFNLFQKWKDEKIIDSLEMVKFICKVLLKINNIVIDLKETNGKAYLEECVTDDWTNLELNMFLHFYNNGNVLFLFEDFDKISVDHKNIAFTVINAVKNDVRSNKLWVISRPNSDMLSDLEVVLERTYRI